MPSLQRGGLLSQAYQRTLPTPSSIVVYMLHPPPHQAQAHSRHHLPQTQAMGLPLVGVGGLVAPAPVHLVDSSRPRVASPAKGFTPPPYVLREAL